MEYLINNTACMLQIYRLWKFGWVQSQLIVLMKKKKKTSVNFKPFNLASVKGRKRLICHEIMMGLFLNGHNSFCKGLENIDKDIVFPWERKQKQQWEKGDISPQDILLQTSWENCFIRCWLLRFQKICNFRYPDGVQVQSGLGAFFRYVAWIQDSAYWIFVQLVNSTW